MWLSINLYTSVNTEITWILLFSWCLQSALCCLYYAIYTYVCEKKAVYFAAFQKCRCNVLFIPSTQTEPVRASLKYAACRYRVSNTFCVPCMKTVSVNNCLIMLHVVFVNHYVYSTACKMLPNSLLQPSLNVSRLEDPVNPPTVQEEVPPPKISICNLILFNIFHNKKCRIFWSKNDWNNSPNFSTAIKEKTVST